MRPPRRALLIGLLACLTAPLSARAATYVYVSAATERRIVLFRLDREEGSLTQLGAIPTPGEPGALTVAPDRRRLFAAMRDRGTLAGFRIDPANGGLTAVNVVEAGADPAQISTDPTGRFLFTAYYVAGKVSVHAIGRDGSLSTRPVSELPTFEKAHAAVCDRTGSFLFVPHTAPDRIEQFVIERTSGVLARNLPPRVTTPPRTGPRHLAWHPDLPIAYVSNEQGSSATSYRMQPETGRLYPIETRSTLPDGFSGPNSCAEIRVHPSGRFVYVSNRGHDSLAGFEVAPSGEHLTSIGQFPTEKTPRSFDIDPSGRYLIAAGESSGVLAVYRIDVATGALEPLAREPVGPRLWWVTAVEVP